MKYKRFTQWTESGASLILDNPQNAEEARAQLMEKFKLACNKLAELEDKIEQGTLIELPCKVGDTVYSNERIMFEPVIVKVITTHQSMNLPVSYTVFAMAKDGYGIYLSSENFNKDWFLTREEAEKRLKELQE